SDRSLMCLPSSKIRPSAMVPPTGSRPMIDNAVMVLPQPDSPTIPSVSPGSTCRGTPSTGCTVPWRSLMLVCRFSICSTGVTSRQSSLPALQPGLECVSERVADEVERDAGDDDRDPSWIDEPPVALAALQVLQAAREHRSPVRG